MKMGIYCLCMVVLLTLIIVATTNAKVPTCKKLKKIHCSEKKGKNCFTITAAELPCDNENIGCHLNDNDDTAIWREDIDLALKSMQISHCKKGYKALRRELCSYSADSVTDPDITITLVVVQHTKCMKAEHTVGSLKHNSYDAPQLFCHNKNGKKKNKGEKTGKKKNKEKNTNKKEKKDSNKEKRKLKEKTNDINN
ncbi:unnamed protein product [Meganyctiphanes norvegica]|uniref:Uncharacterized protein n=1 Tax=Meganyctiphanes norvegica TaxID=48144 RepID=A0AAV2QM38_MEGNR